MPAATYRSLAKHDIFMLAGAIAYSALLSFFPLIISVIALLSLFIDEATARQAVVAALSPYLPPEAAGAVRDTLEGAASNRATAGSLAVLMLLWTATTVAGTLRRSLNTVLEASAARSFWHRKAIELAMVGVAGALILFSVLQSAALTLIRAVPELAGPIDVLGSSRAWEIVARAGPWVLSEMAFLMMYRYLPNARVRRGSLVIGSAVALVLFELTKAVFFWYLLALARYPLAYGPLAGIIVFMVWVYLASLVTLVGAAAMRQTDDFFSPPAGPS